MERLKRAIGVVALLALLAALGTGGWVLYDVWRGGGSSKRGAPVPIGRAPGAPDALPVPELAGEEPAAAAVFQATLVGLERSVKARRADELSWKDARQRMRLRNNDAIRTLDNASAIIEFGKDDIVEVGQNALVVIRPRRTEVDAPEISLALLSPELFESLETRPADERQRAIEAEAAARQVRIRRLPAGPGEPGGTRVAVRTLPDRSTGVSSLGAPIRLVGPKGDEVVLRKNMVTRISPQGAVAVPRLLPDAPDLDQPGDGATFPLLRRSQQVELRWKRAERAAAYRVLVARDHGFRRVFAEEVVSGTSFGVRNLDAGTYFWRVRSQDTDGFEGGYSPAWSLRTVADTAPPMLAISAPPEMFVSPGPRIELKGATEREARIRVNGEPATIGPDGAFTFTLTLKEGVNLITVEAIDAAGNTSYGKRLITYKGPKRTSAAGLAGDR